MDFTTLKAYLDRKEKEKHITAPPVPELDPNAIRDFQQGSGFAPDNLRTNQPEPKRKKT